MGSLLLIVTSLVTTREAEKCFRMERKAKTASINWLVCQSANHCSPLSAFKPQRFRSVFPLLFMKNEEFLFEKLRPDTAPRGPESNQICLAMIYLATSGSVAPAYSKKLPVEHYSATGCVKCCINYFSFLDYKHLIALWTRFCSRCNFLV